MRLAKRQGNFYIRFFARMHRRSVTKDVPSVESTSNNDRGEISSMTMAVFGYDVNVEI